MNEEVRTRRNRVIRYVLILAVAAGCTAWFLIENGMYLPCPFRSITGYLCPGCGVTRMCLSVLQLDFARAFSYNSGVFIAAPFLMALIFKMTAVYIRTGNWNAGKAWNVLAYMILLFLVLFGILRNLV